MCKIRKLKISHQELSDPAISRNIIDILNSNYDMTLLNLSNCCIQLDDMLAISTAFIQSVKLEVLNISGNKITVNGLIPRDVTKFGLKSPDLIEKFEEKC